MKNRSFFFGGGYSAVFFVELPRVEASSGIGVAVRKPNEPRKRLLKGKQMFVNKVIEKGFLVAGRYQRERIFGVQTVRRRIAARF